MFVSGDFPESFVDGIEMAKKTVTLRRRWLGRLLRQLREENGLTLDASAEFLQRTAPTVSKVESGIYPIRRPDVMALLDLYNVTEPRKRDGLLQMSEDAWQTGWWDGYADDFDQWFVDFVWLEEQAIEHRLFDNALLPGLLQTEDYARAVNQAGLPGTAPALVERLIELRMTRQELLQRDDPPLVRCVVDESVFRRPVGGRAVMTAQLQHLLHRITLPRLQLRVLTYAAAAQTCPSNAFNIFCMADPYPDVVYAETSRGGVYIEHPDTGPVVDQYTRLWESALNEADSAGFISALIEESW